MALFALGVVLVGLAEDMSPKLSANIHLTRFVYRHTLCDHSAVLHDTLMQGSPVRGML